MDISTGRPERWCSVRHKTNPTLLEVALRRVGFRRAVVAMTYLVKWGVYCELEPEPHRVDEFAKWAGVSLAAGYRQREAFGEAFPEYESPAAVWPLVKEAIDRKASERVQVGQACAVRVA